MVLFSTSLIVYRMLFHRGDSSFGHPALIGEVRQLSPQMALLSGSRAGREQATSSRPSLSSPTHQALVLAALAVSATITERLSGTVR